MDSLGCGILRRGIEIAGEVDDVVTPPKAAARLAASGGWVMTSGRPAQRLGHRDGDVGVRLDAARQHNVALRLDDCAASVGKRPGEASATILPSCTPTSRSPTSSGVTTRPPRMTRSSIVHLHKRVVSDQ